MTSDLESFLHLLARAPAVLVSVSQVRGSVPRERGAWMAVFVEGQVGTIGGGHLEWVALQQARSWLALPDGSKPEAVWERWVTLGPSLGQCCGGQVHLCFEPVMAHDAATLRDRLKPVLRPLGLFGGGHVGRAIVQALAPLPFEVTWIDSRDEVFPENLSPQVHAEHSDPVQAAVGDLEPDSMVLIMSFSHAEDLDIVGACLQRQRIRSDLPFVGLIGSRTKWASFRQRLVERGFSDAELAHITCPIGLPGIVGKEPAVIAASVVAQLLLLDNPTGQP